MIIKVDIWSQLKERREDGSIALILENNIEINDEDITEFVVEQYRKNHSTRGDRTYHADIDKTII